MKIAIVNIRLQYEFENNISDEEIENTLMDVELPVNYVENSFDLVKIIKE